MRMDLNRIRNQPSAADILSHIDEDSLTRILKVIFVHFSRNFCKKMIIIILGVLEGIWRGEAG